MKRRQTWRILAVAATLAGIFLISGMFWADILDPLIYDNAGAYRTDGVFRALSPIVLQLKRFLDFGWLYGIPLLLAGLMGTILTLPIQDWKGGMLQRHRLAFCAIGVGVAAHVLALAFSVQFFFVPAGSHIRPMAWAVMGFIITLCTFVVCVPVGIASILKEKPRFLGVIGMILGFTPFWFSSFILHFASWIKGFEISS